MGTRGKDKGSLALRIVVLVLVSIAIVTATTYVVSSRLGARVSEDTVSQTLTGSYSLNTLLRQQRYRHLDLIARFLATDQQLTRSLIDLESDDITILDSLEEYQNLLGFDLGFILDPNGRVVARTDRKTIDAAFDDDSLIAVALDENEAFGVWQRGDDLFHAAAVPLVRQFDLVGYAVVAFAADDAYALHIKRASNAEVVLFRNSPTGPIPAASTISAAEADALISELRLQGQVLARVQSGETIDRIELTVGNNDYVALLTPLRDARDQSTGTTLAMIPRNRSLGPFRWIERTLLIGALVVLLISVPVALWLSKGASAPLAALADKVEDADAGLPIQSAERSTGSGEIDRIDRALHSLLGRWSRRSAVQTLVANTSASSPTSDDSNDSDIPSMATSASLIAIELKRFANPKIAYDADENVDRFRRDVKRISNLARDHGGRLCSISGHRALVVVDEKVGPHGALRIAASALRLLGQRETVFDEPSPPTIALTHGATVVGGLGSAGSIATLGIPIQQLDSLMREASPGELYFTRNFNEKITELLAAEGVVARKQRGLLSPQPLFVLSAEQSALAAGISSEETPTAENSFEFEPGALLGSRFELLDQLAGRDWFKARDRQRNDPVTLKLLAEEMVADPHRFELLRNNMLQARLIEHPNVLRVFDFGEEDSIPYVSFEFRHGVLLSALLDADSPFPVPAALDLAIQLSSGIEAIHNANLIHGRLDPRLALISSDGRACWADVGLVATRNESFDPRYLSPECLSGEPATSSDDIYSLGTILYQLFCGQPPFGGSTKREVFEQVTVSDPVEPEELGIEITSSLRQAIFSCISRSARERPSATALLEQLHESTLA